VLRWNPLFDIIRRLIAERAIGDVFYAEVDYWHGLKGWSGLDWGASIAGGGSTMLTAGCHALDALRWFVQDDVVEVSAMSNNHAGRFEYDANVVAILRFAGGAIGKSSTLFDFEAPYALNIDLAGSEGTIRDNRLWSRHLLPGQTDWATVPTILPDSGAVEHHPFDAQMAHFVECIQTGRDSHCNIADAYKTHELCLAIDRSLELGGQPVRLPLA
jgi:predicted dehydrogenase